MLEGKKLAFINDYDVQNYFASPFSKLFACNTKPLM